MPLPLYPTNAPVLEPKKILGIAAGKGGVGKSLLTTHLALALQKKGEKVGILDADLYGPSIRKMLGDHQLPYKSEGKISPAVIEGIKVISMSYFRDEVDAAILRAPMTKKILSQFLNQVDWGLLDWLLVDFPPGTGDIQLNLCQEVQFAGAIVVTTPQEISLLDVRKAVDLFFKMQVPLLGVIENMSYFEDPLQGQKYFLFGKGGGHKLAREYGMPLLGEIPLDPTLSKCADEGRSHDCHHEDSPLGMRFSQLAQRISDEAKKDFFPEGQIFQKDSTTLSIVWKDDSVTHLQAFEIQKHCPCAECRLKTPISDETVQIREIENVGRYALRFNFTAGCSKGIYEFSFLKKMRKE